MQLIKPVDKDAAFKVVEIIALPIKMITATVEVNMYNLKIVPLMQKAHHLKIPEIMHPMMIGVDSMKAQKKITLPLIIIMNIETTLLRRKTWPNTLSSAKYSTTTCSLAGG